MKDIKPVAWIVSDGGSQFITTKEDELKNAIRFNWTVTPLYAIPEGCVVVPVDPTKAMRAAFHEANEEFEEGENYKLVSPDCQWSAMLKAAQEEWL